MSFFIWHASCFSLLIPLEKSWNDISGGALWSLMCFLLLSQAYLWSHSGEQRCCPLPLTLTEPGGVPCSGLSPWKRHLGFFCSTAEGSVLAFPTHPHSSFLTPVIHFSGPGKSQGWSSCQLPLLGASQEEKQLALDWGVTVLKTWLSWKYTLPGRGHSWAA